MSKHTWAKVQFEIEETNQGHFQQGFWKLGLFAMCLTGSYSMSNKWSFTRKRLTRIFDSRNIRKCSLITHSHRDLKPKAAHDVTAVIRGSTLKRNIINFIFPLPKWKPFGELLLPQFHFVMIINQIRQMMAEERESTKSEGKNGFCRPLFPFLLSLCHQYYERYTKMLKKWNKWSSQFFYSIHSLYLFITF